SPVLRIEQSEGSVGVIYSKAGARLRVTGDRLVCALPFTVLRRLEVAPRFSAAKQAAVEGLPLTSVVRTYVQSRTKVWREAGLSGEALLDEPRAWFTPYGHPGRRDILEAFSTGEAARRLGRLDEAARVNHAVEQAARFFPSLVASFEGGASVDWGADEWARGAWTWYKPGQLTSLASHAARPEGRVHFAGEHTSAWPGWMQGALDSGLRAAREVNDAP
ncbi:MAG TPA: FAD-dependent oxidoreductase, partial [Pyrinomonadaceae bacterium]|nr:FAD-dependent oxidoreductase [Pyrinomonadaceae bacterium]